MMNEASDHFAFYETRRDLVVQKQVFGRRTYWNIKDPISERFFQLRDEEVFILRRFDRVRVAGNNHPDATNLAEAFTRQFSPQSITSRELDGYVAMLVSHGLLIDRRQTGSGLLRRREQSKRLARRATWLNPLAIRWRGINPSLLVDWIYPYVRWCFHRFTLAVAIAVVIGSWLVLLSHLDQIAHRLPTLQAFFTLQNLFGLAVATAFAKVLHELAHALTCKHFGGDCKELGGMLLVFTPCLYCDVSDAWFFPNKWHRIAVSSAGIVVELLLASLAALLWWFSEPGSLNTLCFNVMVVCSVGTVLFNGNPLLKFDGYYILADWVEVPNLRARASAAVGHYLSLLCLGITTVNPRTLPDCGRAWLAAYGIAAMLYRVLIMISIMLLLYRVLAPYGLANLAQVLSALMLVSLLTGMSSTTRQFLRRARWRQVRIVRVVTASVVLIAFWVTVFMVPLPHHVVAPVVVEPHESTPVFVQVSGRVPVDGQSVARNGQRVKQGDVLVALENPTLELEISELRGTLELLQMRSKALETRRLSTESVAGNLSATKNMILAVQQRLQEKQALQQALKIRAPTNGELIAPEIIDPRSDQDARLDQWLSTPLDDANRGCTLPTGLQLCAISPTDQVAVIAAVEQADIRFVQINQSATVWIRGCPGRKFHGVVADVSLAPFTTVPRTLATSNTLPLVADSAGEIKNAELAYTVRILVNTDDCKVPIRSIGWIKIRVPDATLASRMRHYLGKTFRLSW